MLWYKLKLQNIITGTLITFAKLGQIKKLTFRQNWEKQHSSSIDKKGVFHFRLSSISFQLSDDKKPPLSSPSNCGFVWLCLIIPN